MNDVQESCLFEICMMESHRLLQARPVEIYTYKILLMISYGDCYRRGLQSMEILERSDAFEAWLS